MFLGVDIGTTGIKTSVVDPEGNICSTAYAGLTMHGLNEQKKELDPLEILDKVKATVKEAKKGHEQEIQVITISSLGEAVVPVDASGNALMNSIVGSDGRGANEMQWLSQSFRDYKITQITGLNESSIYSLNKILFIKRHEPKVFNRVWKFLCIADYIVFKLTGEACIDYSLASRTMAFDYREYKWSEQILKKADIAENLLPEAVPSGSVAGTLLRSVAGELGLPHTVPVAIGAHDHILNALGSGVVYEGTCSNAVGTTEGLTAYLGSKRLTTETITDNNISCEPFVIPFHFNTVAWHNTAGAMLNWFIDLFFQGGEKDKQRAHVLQLLNKTCDRRPSNLLVVPHFSGATTKHMDDKAKGSILGLTLSTSTHEIYKALLEGSTYELLLIFQALTEAGITMDRIVVSGGGSRSRLWLETKADILGKKITTLSCPETGSIGSAILASVRTGYYPNITEATQAMVQFSETVYPDERYYNIYQQRFTEYKGLYNSHRKINQLLQD